MLNQLIIDMKSQLAKAKQEVAGAIADEKKLQADAESMKKQAEDWERRAMLAVQEGRDDLAKQALLRYNEHLQGAQQLHETWVKHKAETESLKGSLRQLNDKIEEAKRKKNILVARAKRAEAQQRIQETMSGMSDKSAFESFERMTEKIEDAERKAIASAELQEEFSGDTLMQQFEALEYKGSARPAAARAQGQDGAARRRRRQGNPADRQGRRGRPRGRGAGDREGRRRRTAERRRRGRQAWGVEGESPFHAPRGVGTFAHPPTRLRATTPMSAPRFLILADRDFGPLTSKTANSIIRYLPDRTVAVLDTPAGRQDRPGRPRLRRRHPGGGHDARGARLQARRRS